AVPTLEIARPGRSVPCSRVAGFSCSRTCSTSSLTCRAVPLLRRKSAFWPSPIRTSALWEMMGVDSLVIILMPPCGPTQESLRGCLCDDDAQAGGDLHLNTAASSSRTDGTPVSLLPASEPKPARCFEPRGQHSNQEELMRKIAIGLLTGAGALLTGSANASDVYINSEYSNSDLIQQVRMVCDDDGRCYR